MQVDWSRLQHVKPILLPDVEQSHQQIRGEAWTVLHNTVTGQHIRLNGAARNLVNAFDGNTTLKAICGAIAGKGEALELSDINQCVATLCHGGMVSLGVAGDEERLLKQYEFGAAAVRRQRWLSPLAIKLPLLDPDAWLTTVTAHIPWLFSRTVSRLALGLMAVAVLQGFLHASLISAELIRIASSPGHWWLYLVLYPLLKALHEFAHAVCIKHWGGEVHEIGITLLVLIPVPYVDASDVWHFRRRRHRLLVSAAGMIAECTLAALALLIWIVVEPGIVRDVAFAIGIMGSVSTLVFNANPLLKFDGYYLLQDWLDMPNLASRAAQYYQYLIRRYLFAATIPASTDESTNESTGVISGGSAELRAVHSPVTGAGERRWLLAYGAASPVYRVFIMISIALFLTQKYFIAGALLGIFTIAQLVIRPLWRSYQYLRTSSELCRQRSRAYGVTAALLVLPVVFISVVPFPSSTRTEGIVWVPAQAQLFAAQSGVVTELHAIPGHWVEAGQLLLSLTDPTLKTQLIAAQARVQVLQIKYRAAQQGNRALAALLANNLQTAYQQEAQLASQVALLHVHASVAGNFTTPAAAPLIGKPIKQGELLAYIVNPHNLVVHAVVDQHRIGRIHPGEVASTVRLGAQISKPLSATLTRQTPAGNNQLPSPALAYNGNSGIAVASQSTEELKTLEPVFHVELALDSNVSTAGIGGRAFVTLHHNPESIGARWWRASRQLLLKHLNV